jgi:hypothetical protein
MVLAGLTPPEWEISIVDENLGAPDYAAMPVRTWWAISHTGIISGSIERHTQTSSRM